MLKQRVKAPRQHKNIKKTQLLKKKAKRPVKTITSRHITTTSINSPMQSSTRSACKPGEYEETDNEATMEATPGLFPPHNHNPLFMVCDIQEPFRKRMENFPRLIESSKLLLNYAKVMKHDVLVSEQMPLAGTVPEIKDLLETFDNGKVQLYKKRSFSMIQPLLSKNKDENTQHINIDWSQYSSVVLFGIESHVCILQTYNDLSRLLPTEVPIYLITDATYSQRDYDRSSALRQMIDANQISSEALLYGLMGSADHPAFKPMLEHVKNHAKWIAENGDVKASV